MKVTRQFIFESFEDAIHFMATASRAIAKYDHHPEWSNKWRTVLVYLSTWDIGDKVSIIDIDVASYLNELYKNYQRNYVKPYITL
jgi:pterin-4a-carbinolamine dehydratase